MKNLTLETLLQSINEDSSVNKILQSSPVCHKIFDPDFKLRFMSQSGVSALQIENIDDFYGHIFPTDAAPQNTRDIVNEHMHLAAKGKTNTIEYSFEVDGHVIWFRTTISPFFNSDGDLIYITADSMDITSNKKTEETNRTLLETSPICLKEIHKNNGPGFTLTFMSPAGQKQLNLANEEQVYGKSYPLDFYPTEAKKAITEAMDNVVNTGKSTQVECKLVDNHGDPVWYLSTFSPLRKNEAGEVIAITGASQNVTEKVVNQAALAKSKEEAERANKAKSEFLSRMSHELRTPLNAILGFSQMMKREPDMDIEERTSSVDLIYNAGNHLLGLVDEVLDLSKIETGKFTITTEDLNASLKMKDLISQIQPIAKAKDITVLNRLSEQDDLYIKADNKAFNQIILNLLNNAAQYNKKAGSITLDGGIFGNDKIWLSVTDTGPGIAKENMEKLFEPFNRLGKEYSDIKGAGIGLNICKTLVELLGGTLFAESDLGNGCCFKVVLPVGNRECVKTDDSNQESNITNTDFESKSYKVLYIEDNYANLKLVEKVLQSNSRINFLSAKHPIEGIELARAHKPDLILMDMQLPDMDGTTAFCELQKFKETSDIPVIALTAQAMQEDIDKAMNYGFKDYITKPFDVRGFLEKINTIIDEGDAKN
jgi:signal transduction histidine kinase/CheY-like chemotaxis protein